VNGRPGADAQPTHITPHMEIAMIRNLALIALAGALVAPSVALADDGISPGTFVANNVWMMLAAALVFIMHLGFSMVETGLTRAKNTVNILFKNVFIICAGIFGASALIGQVSLIGRQDRRHDLNVWHFFVSI